MIDFSKSNKYSLSIRLSADGFSFFVYSPEEKKTLLSDDLALDSYCPLAINIKNIFEQKDFLSHKYQHYSLLINNNRFTIVPLELFDDKAKDELFYAVHAKEENETIFYDVLSKSNCVILYAVDKSALNYIKEKISNITISSSIGRLIEYLATKSCTGNNKKTYIEFIHEGIIVYSFDHGRLLLTNFFKAKKLEDKIYFILNAWQQLKLDQLKDELYIFPSKETYKLEKRLKTFVDRIEILNQPFNDIELLLCE